MSTPPIHPAVRIGHVHLKVAALERAVGFYRDVPGFEVMRRMGRQAAFFSAVAAVCDRRHLFQVDVGASEATGAHRAPLQGRQGGRWRRYSCELATVAGRRYR